MISETALWFFRASAYLWKYLVFLSPLKNQRFLDFCLQYSSSVLHAEKKTFWSSSSFLIMQSVIVEASMRNWCSSSSAWAVFLFEEGMTRSLAQFFRSVLSLLSLDSHMKDGEPLRGVDQESVTTCRKSSCWIQRGLKRKGIGPRLGARESSRRMGLWSEVQWGRILEEAKRPRVRKEEWTRNLSSRAATWPGPTLLFVQVNFPLAGFYV